MGKNLQHHLLTFGAEKTAKPKTVRIFFLTTLKQFWKSLEKVFFITQNGQNTVVTFAKSVDVWALFQSTSSKILSLVAFLYSFPIIANDI